MTIIDSDARYARNALVVQEFRANGGRVGGNHAGHPILLLHTTGWKSGLPRVNPIYFTLDGDDWIVFASKGGWPTDPDWYVNLRLHPRAKIETGSETIEVEGSTLMGDERQAMFAQQASRFPIFAEYQSTTDRVIPVVRLRRLTAGIRRIPRGG